MGTFDFHPWPVRRADTDRPDELRIDLDPQPGTDFADAKAVAAVLREVLDEAGLVGWPKTSGGRGIHVFCRIRPEWDFIAVRHAVIAIARRVAERLPERATVDWWKEERGERVFLDYNQAARDRTVASAWSVRGRPRATVSMPVTWETLPDVEPEDFDVRTVPGLLARARRPAHRHGRRRSAASRRCSTGTPPTSATAGSATCPTRPSTRRCRASRCGCSRAVLGHLPAKTTRRVVRR